MSQKKRDFEFGREKKTYQIYNIYTVRANTCVNIWMYVCMHVAKVQLRVLFACTLNSSFFGGVSNSAINHILYSVISSLSFALYPLPVWCADLRENVSACVETMHGWFSVEEESKGAKKSSWLVVNAKNTLSFLQCTVTLSGNGMWRLHREKSLKF